MQMPVTQIKDLKDLFGPKPPAPALIQGWRLKAVVNGDNMTYVVGNESSKEALILDPMREDWEPLKGLCAGEFSGFRFLAVIDTHTHADHVSCAARLAEHLNIPLLMSEKSPTQKAQLRVSRDCTFPTAAGPLKLWVAPGHTPDGIIPVWGPFLFSGDTLLYGDIGRGDLPGGDPEAHFETVAKLKRRLAPETLILPGHDEKGGRVSSWQEQLGLNVSLTQDRETFVREAAAYVGPAPKAFKESLFENFK